MVNAVLARRDFPGQSPIGKRFYDSDTTFVTIVGEVSDIRNHGPFDDPVPEAYFPYGQSGRGDTRYSIMVRVKGDDPLAVAGSVRAAIRGVDPEAAVSDIRTMPDVIARSVGTPRFYLTLLAAFAAVALILAVASLYGVMSYTVEQRSRELGIRSALGSSAGQLVHLVTGRGLALIGGGVVIGVAGGVVASRVLRGLLYGVSPIDRVSWLVATAALVAAGILATLVPALRAARADPLTAIRLE